MATANLGLQLVASVDKNQIKHILNFCDRHDLMPCLSDDRKRWILKQIPKPNARILRLVKSED